MKYLYFILGLGFLTACNNSNTTTEQATDTPLLTWEKHQLPTNASFRGIHAYSDKVIWLSGSNGTFVHTADGGLNWEVDSIADTEKLDFRDIEVLNDTTVIVISAGSPGRVYKTTDAGKNWTRTYNNESPAVFFDGMDFWDKDRGIAFSDPIDGKLFMIQTNDGGNNWSEIEGPVVAEGEAGFAASGSGIIAQNDSCVWIGTGGAKARVFYSSDKGSNWTAYDTPMLQGNGPQGIYGMDFKDSMNGIAIGGNFQDSVANNQSLVITEDGGKTWSILKENATAGYKSSVKYVPNSDIVVAVSRYGTDISENGGKAWKNTDKESYYAISFPKNSQTGWACGSNGRIAKVIISQ
ncbi:YCF48-related protein [Limibacter armeniacum]|uniref:WD40/YVTN/BNR-like repeat-containing protein n=1 Tax=Limibacter armeniacum TaxID=466084 RepID=UPI002FE50132